MECLQVTLVEEVHSLGDLDRDLQPIKEGSPGLPLGSLLEEYLSEGAMRRELCDDTVALVTVGRLACRRIEITLEGAQEGKQAWVSQLKATDPVVESKLPLKRIQSGPPVLLNGNVCPVKAASVHS